MTDPATRSLDGLLAFVGLLGVLAFGGAFAVATLMPEELERRAHAYVVSEVSAEVDRRFDAVDSIAVPDALTGIAERFRQQADTLQAALNAGLSTRLAEVLSAMCHYDCGETESLDDLISGVLERQISVFQAASRTALSWARDRYSETVTALVADLRIFAGINAILFLFVLLGALLAPAAPNLIRVLTWLLVAATGSSMVMYFLGIDWFYVLVTGDLVGKGYLIWVGVTFLFYCDWVLLRATITEMLISALGSVG